jgi:two-component system, response regulator YesN
MPKLIIVDDETVTRESLRDYIAWMELGIQSVRTARNGVEALSLCVADQPDIVLTDVRMPKMDGIRFAERVRKMNPRCKIVFLSGYADKEYLKSAIQLRATSYVEKPIDRNEVRAAIEAAVRAWREEESRFAVAEHGQPGYEETLDLVRDEICRTLVTGDPKAQALFAAYPKELPTFTADAVITVVAIQITWRSADAAMIPSEDRGAILRAARSVEPFTLSSTLIGYVGDDRLALIAARRLSEDDVRARVALESLAACICQTSVEIHSVRVGVGLHGRGPDTVPDSFESARGSLDRGFYRDGQDVLYPSSDRARRFSLAADTRSEFRVALEMTNYDRAAEVVNRVVEAIRHDEPIDVNSVRNAFFELYIDVFEVVWRSRTTDSHADPKRSYIWQGIRELSSLTDLSGFVLSYLRSSIGQTTPGSPMSSRIKAIHSYVHDRYDDPGLSLQSIADHVGLSRTYVSSLFKDATGENVIDYLTRVRIDWAKELLSDPRITAGEVATRVGYNDPGYFSALFKKRVGVTPSVYRKGP